MGTSDSYAAIAVFAFLAVGAVSLFTMISVSSWAEARRKERESYYRNDMLKKLSEGQGAGVDAAFRILREEDRLGALRRQQGLKIGGLILTAIGIGVFIFLRALIPHAPIYLSGVLVFLLGAALFGSSYIVTVSE